MGTIAAFLRAWRGSTPEFASAPSSQSTSAYPPVMPCIAYRTLDDILSPHEELIGRIKLAYGAERREFETAMLPLIRRYAAYVHLLPATAHDYFSAPGGLLRLGLEIGFYSLQGTDGQIFAGRASISDRRALEPRWRRATFIAGLCHEIHRTLGTVLVTDDTGAAWPAYLVGLDAWLHLRKAARFLVRWRGAPGDTRSLGVFALRHVVPETTLQDLGYKNSVIVPHMMASIAGMGTYPDRNILDQLVRRAAALVIDRDLRSMAHHQQDKAVAGLHLERYVLDAMHRLVSTHHAWRPNTEKSRVWYGADGLFLVWPNAAADLIKLLEAERLCGMPKTAQDLLDIFAASRMVEAAADGGATCLIHPPPGRVTVEAIRLASPEILFQAGNAPEPLATPLVPPATAGRSKPSAGTNRSPQLPIDLSAAIADRCGEPDTGISSTDPGDALIPLQTPAAIARAPRVRLHAPPRLNPTVVAALEEILRTLQDGLEPAACVTPLGLFVPLSEWERRRVDPGIAVRALGELDMLVCAPGTASKTLAREFRGTQCTGLLVSPRHITGLESDDAARAAPES